MPQAIYGKKKKKGGVFEMDKHGASSVISIKGMILEIMLIGIISTSSTVLRNIVLLNNKTLRNFAVGRDGWMAFLTQT